jgi:integrase
VGGAVKPGLTFHGLRHSHNTWMIDDGIMDVARARRLGHHVPTNSKTSTDTCPSNWSSGS